MKIYIILLLAFCSFSAYSQQKNIFKNKPWEVEKKNLLNNPLKPGFNFKDNSIDLKDMNAAVVKIPLEGRYAGNNGNGSAIYLMETYKMPCLVPDKSVSFNMPVVVINQQKEDKLSAPEMLNSLNDNRNRNK